MRVLQAPDRIQVPKESILFGCAGMIGDLELCTVLFGIMVDVCVTSS